MIKLPTSSDLKSKTVYSTTEYDKFRFADFNRPISLNHVKNLKCAIETSDNTALFPIIVSPNFIIYDGQHRFQACRELGLPIQYVIAKNFSLTDLITTNRESKRWDANTYLKVYAQLGYEDYVALEQDCLIYELPCPIVMLIIYGRNNCDRLKEGTLRYGESQTIKVKAFSLNLSDFKNLPFYKEVRFMQALYKLLIKKEYNHAIMQKQIKRYSEKLIKRSTQMAYFIDMVKLYNHNRCKSSHINLTEAELADWFKNV